MGYGLCLSMIGLCCGAGAYMLRGPALILTWPALSFVVAGGAYLGAGPRVFGKSRDGTRRIWSCVLMLPYTVLLLATWHVWRLMTREPSFHELTSGVLIGRRLLPHEYPPTVGSVVDLTCEFRASLPSSWAGVYLNLGVLDATAPALEDLRELVGRIEDLPAPVYIHCANGHGRTGLVAAVLLLARQEAARPEAALSVLTDRRPAAHLNRVQKKALSRFAAC